MKRLLILGAGQYGAVAKETAEAMNIFDEIEFLDDNSEVAIGKMGDLDKLEYDATFVAIGNPDIREKLAHRVGEKLFTLIHPKSTVSPSAVVGKGCIIEAGAVVGSHSEIGEATIVMSNVVVGHNAKVGSYCQLKYNSSVCESSSIPDKTKVDCNTVWA